MNWFAAPQHISLAKLPAFYQRFQTEEGALRLIEAKVTTENAFKVTMNIVTTKKPSFGIFWRFVTSALTLRPRNTYIYVFRVLFGFFIF